MIYHEYFGISYSCFVTQWLLRANCLPKPIPVPRMYEHTCRKDIDARPGQASPFFGFPNSFRLVPVDSLK